MSSPFAAVRPLRVLSLFAALGLVAGFISAADETKEPAPEAAVPASQPAPGAVACANLIYGAGKTSVCYSPEFLAETGRLTHIVTHAKFTPVKIESDTLYRYPFCVWTGEGSFTLSADQRHALRTYLTNGGFIVASAGCSSPEWCASFRADIARTFPELKLEPIDFSHALFHTVHDIDKLDCRKLPKDAHLEGLEIDGRIVLVFSEDGLNDTAKAGKNCCCCGGNEIRNARQINVNLLAYALTH